MTQHKGYDLAELDNNGERMVPLLSHASVFWAHIYRYRFAAECVKGKRVLDIGCGEGYGAAGMRAAGASHVIAVDVAENAVRHAKEVYGLDARAGSAEAIPLEDGSVDVVVSFETIEHLKKPQRFLSECSRVLKPNGILLLSSPDRDGATGQHNPHHTSELNLAEFSRLIAAVFPRFELFTQYPRFAKWYSPRSLAAEDSEWYRLAMFRRIRDGLARLVGLRSQHVLNETMRRLADKMIAEDSPILSSIVNPYVIRKLDWRSGEIAAFMIAMAYR